MGKQDDLYALQVAGLLHDFGKFCHKYNGGRAKHHILSGIFVDNHRELLVGADAGKVINLILKHHDVTDDEMQNTIGTNIEPDIQVTSNDVINADAFYSEIAYSKLVRLLRTADGFSASGDRASETGSDKGAHAEYALMWSPIAKALGHDDIAVKSSSNYGVIRYIGEDDTKDTVLSNDDGFEVAMRQKYKNIMAALSKLEDIEDLNALLEKEWSTVNPNTWRAEGAKIGNTTTSLYDHSKTTAAIAGCLYINDDGSGVDIINAHLNGTSDVLYDFVIGELNGLGLYSMCIISKTKNDVMFMYPHNKLEELQASVVEFNRKIFAKSGETIDYQVATSWQFKGCADVFNDRFNMKKYGVLDVMDVQPYVEDDTSKRCYDLLVGYRLTNFDYIMNHLMDNNESISKVATSLRIFEMFANDVGMMLQKAGINIVEISLNAGYFSVKDVGEYYDMARRIQNVYEKYMLDTTGLIISNTKCDKYCDNLALLKAQLQTYYDKREAKDQKSYIKIRKNLYPFNALMTYLNVKKRITNEGVNTAALVKLLKIMDDLILYLDTGNNECLIALSRLHRLINNENIEANKTFESLCLQRIYNVDKDELNSANLKIYHQAIYDTVHKD